MTVFRFHCDIYDFGFYFYFAPLHQSENRCHGCMKSRWVCFGKQRYLTVQPGQRGRPKGQTLAFEYTKQICVHKTQGTAPLHHREHLCAHLMVTQWRNFRNTRYEQPVRNIVHSSHRGTTRIDRFHNNVMKNMKKIYIFLNTKDIIFITTIIKKVSHIH